MSVSEYFFENAKKYDVEAASMEDAIDILVSMHRAAGNLTDCEQYKRAVLEREAQLPTVLEGGIALAHAKGNGVRRTALAAIRLKEPLLWGTKPVQKVYMLASSDEKGHIEALSALANALQNGENTL